MTINKPHIEFQSLDIGKGWSVPAGYPEGMQHKVLAGELDENNKRGNRTRLLRFDPGIFTTRPFVHTYWEEVYLPRTFGGQSIFNYN